MASNGKATTTISGSLLADVRIAHSVSVAYANSGKGVRHGNNAYTPHGYSAYVAAVASVEAFLNETFLSQMSRLVCKDSSLWDLKRDSLERMDLLLKLIIVPKLLFGSSLKRNEQPYQDFSTLCEIRNDVVHYKMQFEPPKYIDELSRRRIFLTSGNHDAECLWPNRISCTEGILWAHNVACRMANALVSLAPTEQRHYFSMSVENFSELSRDEAYRGLDKGG